MESSVLNFQSAIQSLTFKTFYHSQTQQFGYDDLFANRRVIVLSVPNMFGIMALKTLKSFSENRDELKAQGIDDIYCVSSNEPLIGPWTDKHSTIMGLYDSGNLVKSIAECYNIQKSVHDLKAYWQYILIINDGKPENFWHNPMKSNMTLSLVKNPKYPYHGLTVEKVKDYLATCK